MVSLLLFGFPLVVRDGAVIAIRRHKVTGLLAYLAVTGQRCGRDALAELLFPEQDPHHSRANLRNNLSYLVGAIGGSLLRVERDAVSLPPVEGGHGKAIRIEKIQLESGAIRVSGATEHAK